MTLLELRMLGMARAVKRLDKLTKMTGLFRVNIGVAPDMTIVDVGFRTDRSGESCRYVISVPSDYRLFTDDSMVRYLKQWVLYPSFPSPDMRAFLRRTKAIFPDV